MDREQLARAAVAGGIFILALVAVFCFWFVLPSMQSGDVAMAQEEGAEAPPSEAGEAPPSEAGGPPGGMPGGPPGGMPGGAPGGMPGGAPGGMPGGMPGGPGGGAPTAAPAPPLEPSRANPFAPIDTAEPEIKYVTSKPKYGHDWSKVPVGYFHSLPDPEIPPAPPVALPPNPAQLADLVRVSAIVWPEQDVGVGAGGRAFATWEDPSGQTRLAVPGSVVSAFHPLTRERQSWRVVGIEPEALVLRNQKTGETVKARAEPRSRAEQQYWGGKRLSEDLTAAEGDRRVLPGRGTVLPGGTGAGAAAPGGGMGGMY